MSDWPTELRTLALDLFQQAVAAADPYQAVLRHLSFDGQQLNLAQQPLSGPIHLLAFGKAACAMTQAALSVIPRTQLVGEPLVVTHYDAVIDIPGCKVLGAGHPLPDQNGLQAAQQLAERVKHAQACEQVLLLISGGGSALLPYPVAGVSLADKIATTHLLLASGADIQQINCVRKHLSQLKGGQLARLAAPAPIHALILSDVLGDDLSSIASGPSVADDTTFAQAIDVLQPVWSQLPPAVHQHLQRGADGLIPETPKTGDAVFAHNTQQLVGSNHLSVRRMLQSVPPDFVAQIYSEQLCGEAAQVAAHWAQYAKKLQQQGLKSPLALIAGGETTVSLGQNSGQGGRNQEMALAFALAAEAVGLQGQWTFLSAGTDGRDGPTDAAGGLVDERSLQRMRLAGIDPLLHLQKHDSYPALKAANDLVLSGATGTNVADVLVLLMELM